MKIVMFYHSLQSDWNHGNAHFLRGIASELLLEGHEVKVFEPSDSWSRCSLVKSLGMGPIHRFEAAYPELKTNIYDAEFFRPETAVRDADLVIVHEWNSPDLVARLGKLRRKYPFVLLFHDTHHRMVTDPDSMAAYDLSNYDGVLAFGRVLRDLYLSRKMIPRAWVWHEAADIRRFHPTQEMENEGDVVWIGNWGDEERSAEIHEFLIDPVRSLGLKATVYGVRYPASARAALAHAGISYKGWLPNFRVPEIFSRFRMTLHIPRRPYVELLPGIPTIRPFEAMACGIPLLSAPWNDVEQLFSPGEDFLFVEDGADMKSQMQWLMADGELRSAFSKNGLDTIKSKHTCAHRVRELIHIYEEVRTDVFSAQPELGLAESLVGLGE
jgi:spore maturation protein CgeB